MNPSVKRDHFEPPRNGADAIEDLLNTHRRDLRDATKHMAVAAGAVKDSAKEIERLTTIITDLEQTLQKEGAN